MGILDSLYDNTPDEQTGIAPADRWAGVFQGLTNLGAGLIGYGANTSNPGALMAGVQGFNNSMAGVQQAGALRERQKLLHVEQQRMGEDAARKKQQDEALQAYFTSPQVQQQIAALPPEAQIGVTASLKGGNLTAAVSALKEATESMKPRPLPGGDIYDPKARTVTSPLFGTRSIDQQQGTQIAQGDNTGGQPQATGEEYLKTVPPAVHNMIRGYAAGMLPPPTAAALRNPQMLQMMEMVHNYDPTFDATNYGARYATAKDFAAGQSAKNVTSLNTTMQHLLKMHDAAGALNNGSYPLLNWADNKLLANTGDDRPGNFDAAATAVSDELARVFKGANLSDAEVKNWRETLSSAKSPKQFQGSISTLLDLMDGRMNALAEQKNRGMGTNIKGVDLLSPEARAAMEYVKNNPVGGNKDQPQQQGGGGGGGDPLAGRTATNPQTGQRIIRRDGKWEPM